MIGLALGIVVLVALGRVGDGVAPPWVSPTAAAVGAATVGLVVRPWITGPGRRPVTLAGCERPLRRTGTRRPRWSNEAATALLTGVAALTIGTALTAVCLAMALLARRLRPIRIARRRRAAIERELPAAMDLLVLSVRAGLTPFHAVRDLAATTAGPIGDAFGEVVHRTERGQPFADALDALGEQLGTQAGGLADVIATTDRHGLPLGPVLDQLSAEIRAARRRLDQAAARKLPVRLSFPLVVCTLPSFVLLAIAPAVLAALSSLGGTVW